MHRALKIFATALLLLLVVFPDRVPAQKNSSYHSTYTGSRGGRYHYSKSGKKVYEKSSRGTTKNYKKSSSSSTSSTYSGSSYGVKRDKNGRIKRSSSARLSFMKMTGYPHGRPGYIVDHIIPLKKGGCDCPSNMQWQTISAAREKDKWEAP